MVRAVLTTSGLLAWAVIACESPNPATITACAVDLDCIDGRRCFEGRCGFAPPSAADAGGADAGAVDVGLDGCLAEPAVGTRCLDETQLFCPLLIDGRISSSWEINCGDDANLEGCTPDGRFEQLDLRLGFDQPVTLRGVRFVSDWFSKRPLRFELWGATTATATPETGAKRVLSQPAAVLPWLCAPGATCDYLTPEICCPDGRDAPVDTRLAGEDQAKYDFGSFPPTRGQTWILRLIGADSGDAIFLSEVELLTGLCVERL